MSRQASAARSKPQSNLHFHTLDAPHLGRRRTIRILLPRHYEQDRNRRFPVIYLQDGQNLFEAHTAAFRHWKLREMLDKQPLYRQAILVGIDHGGIDRIHEYAPYARGRSGGQGDAYLRFLSESVKPFVDHQYRTWAHREATAIAGASMGGLIALYGGLRYGHIFGKTGSLSPSLWFNPAVLDLARQYPGADNQLYIAAAKNEMRSMPGWMEKTYWTLQQSGFKNTRVVLRDRGRHSETFWAREFKVMFEWLFPATVL
jgi:predicted alpha/beta superfamily hydrolase